MYGITDIGPSTHSGFSKVNGFYMKTLLAKTDEDASANADELVKGIGKEIEPLLAGAGPFFGGSQKLTLAEVSILPKSLAEGMKSDRERL